MWYNSVTKDFLNEIDIYLLLYNLGHENEDYFDADEMLDDCYPSVEYYGVTFYPSEIVKNLAPEIYSTITDDEIDRWVQDELYGLERYELKDGDTLDQYINFYPAKEILSTIVWRNDDE